MPYTTRELINRSYFLSSVVARDYEVTTDAQINDGLQLLNALISIKSANQKLIPYYDEYVFNAVVGQEEYFIPNLISQESLTFILDNVRYSMQWKTRKEYFASPRANNINSLPYQYHTERTLSGSDLWMYFNPEQAYEFHLWGKFSLKSVTIDQDLSLTLDLYYIEYLRYALAEYICQEYNITFQPQSEAKLTELEQNLIDISPIDLTTDKVSSLMTGNSLNYGDVNIGKGWRPSIN